MTPPCDALDDFAGPGGWDEGALVLGLRLHGIDYDEAACQTAAAAGHSRERADVTTHPSPAWARGRGYIASPSCTLFTVAGTGVGRLVLDVLAVGIRRIFAGDDVETVRTETRAAVYPTAHTRAVAVNAKRTTEKRWTPERVEAKAQQDAVVACLVLEPARRIMELDPAWVAMEQVPAVLPLWQVYAEELRARGWSCYALILNAADYGVPQKRRRAIFGGSRVRTVNPPEPTHAECPDGPDLLRPTPLLHWISMGQALGWGMHPRPSVTVTAGTSRTGGMNPLDGGSGARDTLRRAREEGHWWETRPATTVVGSYRPEVIAAPGWRTTVSRQNAEGSVTVTIEEAGVLQSFRRDYPWQGSRNKQHEQVGNAIPPLLAFHTLRSVS